MSYLRPVKGGWFKNLGPFNGVSNVLRIGPEKKIASFLSESLNGLFWRQQVEYICKYVCNDPA